MGTTIWLALFLLIGIGGLVLRRVLGKQLSEAERELKIKEIKEDSRLDSYDREQAIRALDKGNDRPRLMRRIGLGVTGLGLVLFLIVGFFSSFVTVPPKDIGVVTSFGRPVGALPNGPHFIAPWQQVTIMDGAVQTDTHNKVGDQENCIKVRIAHQIVACANTYIKWQMKESAADSLFQNYRGFDNIRDSLVDKNLQTVLNEVFESYDPLAVDPKTGGSAATPLPELSKTSLTKMQNAVGGQLTISELAVTVMNYDNPTQEKINALQGQVAQTRIAEQAVKTAEQQALANQKLAASVSKDPNVLVSKCLDMVEGGKAQLPAGFSCWPGNSSAVVVPSANTPK